jgi:hypothetical protein
LEARVLEQKITELLQGATRPKTDRSRGRRQGGPARAAESKQDKTQVRLIPRRREPKRVLAPKTAAMQR